MLRERGIAQGGHQLLAGLGDVAWRKDRPNCAASHTLTPCRAYPCDCTSRRNSTQGGYVVGWHYDPPSANSHVWNPRRFDVEVAREIRRVSWSNTR